MTLYTFRQKQPEQIKVCSGMLGIHQQGIRGRTCYGRTKINRETQGSGGKDRRAGSL